MKYLYARLLGILLLMIVPITVGCQVLVNKDGNYNEDNAFIDSNRGEIGSNHEEDLVTRTTNDSIKQLDFANDDQSTFKVFILMGQSNMRGYAKAENFEDKYKKGLDGTYILEEGKWVPLIPQGDHNGPEVSFVYAMKKAHPENDYGIIKVALDGASISAFMPTSHVSFQLPRQEVYLYDTLESMIETAGKDSIDIEGFLWKQGAADASIEVTAKHYGTLLKDLMTYTRLRTGIKDLPLYIGTYFSMDYINNLSEQQVQSVTAGLPYALDVIQAQNDALKNIPNTTVIFHELLPTIEDGAHYNAKGQTELGILFAKGVLQYEEQQ